MRPTLAIVIALLLATTTVAARAETIVASVNGMVCSLCVTGIEKSFKKVAAVEGVKVDLKTRLVTVQTKAGATLEDAKVTEVIVKAGYAVTGIKRSQ